MQNPLVSVIIPLHNAEPYIQECIESVLCQSYKNLEIIIVENCSTDRSYLLASNYVSETVHLFRSDVPSASVARNHGIKMARGKYIQFLDADDMIPQNKIEQQVSILESNTELCLSFCRWHRENISKINEVICHTYELPVEILIDFYTQNAYLLPHCFLVPHALIDKSGLWDEKLSVNDDGEFFARLFSNAERLIFCEGLDVYYRNTEGSLSKQLSEKAINSELRAIMSISDIILNSTNPLALSAVRSLFEFKIFDKYPYCFKQRSIAIDYLKRRLPSMDIKMRKVSWKEWIYFTFVKLGFFNSPYPL